MNKQEDLPAETETPPNKGDNETKPNDPITEEAPPRVSMQKHIESANKLFGTMSTKKRRFLDCLKGKYSEDPMFKGILNNPENFANFVIEEGLIFFRSEGTVKLAIPNVTIDGTLVRESIIKQGHMILAHLGGHKTLTYLRDQVWWKTIVQDINDYCKSCNLCAITKSSTTKPRGLLKMVPVPNYPWQYIRIDFVGPLPESSNRNGSYDMICVVIDLLTAMAHLVATKQTYKATDMAEVIFDTVYKLHGLLEWIISD